jgi:RNA polymerase sigma-70 factor, ECF subfamily
VTAIGPVVVALAITAFCQEGASQGQRATPTVTFAAAVRSAAVGDDAVLVARLRAGDEDAFVELVERYHTSLLRLASAFVPGRAVAEEVVQETWLGVVRGIDRFEGRSSLKTWLFRILINRARSAGVRERRHALPSSSCEPAVAPVRFAPDGHWRDPPTSWTDDADERLAAADALAAISRCLTDLPESQRQVVLLRDVEGRTAAEVCALLGLSDVNQRVLLHRGRARIRNLLEQELGKD